jgi:hypothetical protein
MFHPIYIFISIAIIECIVSYKWSPIYFRLGIPIYYKTYHCEGTAPTPIEEFVLNQAFDSMLTASLVFKEIGPNEFAFREKFFEFKVVSFTSIMRGRLEIDKKIKNIRIVGLINFWSFSMILYLIIAFNNNIRFLIFAFSVLTIIYLIQRIKYDRVGKFVYKWNSRDWSK